MCTDMQHGCLVICLLTVPLKEIIYIYIYGVYGDVLIIYPKPYSTYLRGPLPSSGGSIARSGVLSFCVEYGLSVPMLAASLNLIPYTQNPEP